MNYNLTSKLPIRFQEHFDHMFGSTVGPHKSMIEMLISSYTKLVLFGNFCYFANEMNLIQHSHQMLKYLDVGYYIKKKTDILFGEGDTCPEAFSKFHSPGKHNVMHFKKIWVIFFMKFVKEREDCI